MNEHDPLCHAATIQNHDPECCDCGLIAKVRSDERERIALAIEAADDGRYGMKSEAYNDAARIARGDN